MRLRVRVRRIVPSKDQALSDEQIAEIETRLREFTGWYGTNPNALAVIPRLLATIRALEDRLEDASRPPAH